MDGLPNTQVLLVKACCVSPGIWYLPSDREIPGCRQNLEARILTWPSQPDTEDELKPGQVRKALMKINSYIEKSRKQAKRLVETGSSGRQNEARTSTLSWLNLRFLESDEGTFYHLQSQNRQKCENNYVGMRRFNGISA